MEAIRRRHAKRYARRKVIWTDYQGKATRGGEIWVDIKSEVAGAGLIDTLEIDLRLIYKMTHLKEILASWNEERVPLFAIPG